jgi:hypothetical protein
VLSHDKERAQSIVCNNATILEAIKDNLGRVVQVGSITLKVYLDPNLEGNADRFAFVLPDLPLEANFILLQINGLIEAIPSDPVSV